MASIIIPRKWTQQPQYPVAISNEWKSIVAFTSISGQPWKHDLKSGIPPVVTGVVTSTVIDKGIASITNDAAGSVIKWQNLKPISSTNDGYAFLVIAAPGSSGGVDTAILIGDEVASAYNQAFLGFNCSDGAAALNGAFSLYEYSSGTKATARSSIVLDNKSHIFIANRLAGNTGPRLYFDGSDVTAASSGVVGASCAAGVYLHQSPVSTGRSSQYPQVLSVIFNRSLVNSEIAELTKNPWQIFRKQSQILYFDVGGGDATAAASSSGVGEAIGHAASIAASDASSTGISTNEAAGGATASGSAESSGQSTVEIVGQEVTPGFEAAAADVSGSGEALTDGSSIAAANSQAAGTGAIEGSGAAIASGDAAISGIGVTEGVGEEFISGISEGSGYSAGEGTATMGSASIASAIMESAGSSTAIFTPETATSNQVLTWGNVAQRIKLQRRMIEQEDEELIEIIQMFMTIKDTCQTSQTA